MKPEAPAIDLPAECLPPAAPIYDPYAVVQRVADAWHVSAKTILGRSRGPRACEARKAAVLAVRKLCPHLSSSEVGDVFDHRDHSTVLYLGRVAARQTA